MGPDFDLFLTQAECRRIAKRSRGLARAATVQNERLCHVGLLAPSGAGVIRDPGLSSDFRFSFAAFSSYGFKFS